MAASSPPPSTSTSTASLSRSHISQDGMRSLADEMLRASLSRNVSSPAPASMSTTTSTSPPPSYRPTPYPFADPALKDSLDIHRGKKAVPSSAPPAGSLSLSTAASLTLTRERDSDTVTSTSSQMTAAEKKSRLRHLQSESDRVNAETPKRSTTGLLTLSSSTDLLFLMDTTGSMGGYIAAAKKQVRDIVTDIKAAFLNEANVRIAVVGYKDHTDSPNIQFLDFTPSADAVHRFLDTLTATGGNDLPEDVLGGTRQAINASWSQQTRCIIHIADAPPHGRVLHDLRDAQDNYPEPGSEPHGLRYEALIQQFVQLNFNYALLRINSTTDRMAFAFSQIYSAGGGDVKLLPTNTHYSDTEDMYGSGLRHITSPKRGNSAALQFEELQLGISYSDLRHLVVRSVTGSVSRSAERLTMALADEGKAVAGAGGAAAARGPRLTSNLTAIREDGGGGGGGLRGGGRGDRRSARNVRLETTPPRWDTPGWLDETMVVEGFCPDSVTHGASTLNDMMAADENIRLSVAELIISARSKPFAKGSLRFASYARTAASTDRFVVKSFMEAGKGQAHLAEDMRIQALCKAFALEFNGLAETEHPIDFIVTSCLQNKRGTSSKTGSLSLEPYIPGDYVKYNSNGLYVRPDTPDDHFNRTAQAFSHFTFERSWGHFLVTDLQGVGNLLTDPAIQTRDPDRFRLNPTNLHQEGFKFFFVGHECNAICAKLGLKSTREMVIADKYTFRQRWPSMDPTVCCSNKLCRRIIRLSSAHSSPQYHGYHWCDACFPQLESSTVHWICVAPGPNHEFAVSRFFHESQARHPPRRCPEHLERDETVSTTAVVGGSMWERMKRGKKKSPINGVAW